MRTWTRPCANVTHSPHALSQGTPHTSRFGHVCPRASQARTRLTSATTRRSEVLRERPSQAGILCELGVFWGSDDGDVSCTGNIPMVRGAGGQDWRGGRAGAPPGGRHAEMGRCAFKASLGRDPHPAERGEGARGPSPQPQPWPGSKC